MNRCNEVKGYQKNVHITSAIMQTQKTTTRRENIRVSEYNQFLRKCSEMSGNKGSEGCNGSQETSLYFHSKHGCAATSGCCAGIRAGG